MRIKIAALGKLTALATAFAGACVLPASQVDAQTASGSQLAQAAAPDNDTPAPRRVRRPLVRVPVYPRRQEEPDGVYPRYNPGPDAVRECSTTYVQENRPSGPVITPRLNCFWRRG